MSRRRKPKILDSARTFTDPPPSMTPPWEEPLSCTITSAEGDVVIGVEADREYLHAKVLRATDEGWEEMGTIEYRENAAFRQEMEKRK